MTDPTNQPTISPLLAKMWEALEKADALMDRATPKDAWDVLCKVGDIVGDALAEPPTPSPTGTELALAEAKRHIDVLCRFVMDNERWVRVSNEAFAFIGGKPK